MPHPLTVQLHEALNLYFGYTSFKGDQQAIIESILQRKNTFVGMSTGAGKSLCYQLPALMQEGLALVITPLIAIMKDQVDQLQRRGIKAAFINSSLPQKVVAALREELLTGNVKLLYIAPETLNKADNMALLKQLKISFVAVDEAHCISDWGHDFRPEYRNIRYAVHQLGELPIIALTATATHRVRVDILENLGIAGATIFQSSFNRANLYYEVRYKEAQAPKQLIKYIKEISPQSTIVYCQSRKTVDEITELLTLNGIKAVAYHAGLESAVRIQTQEAFFQKKCQVVVATIAFGMGIDTSDVQLVVHYDMPKSLESYYQETGRAGRDNVQSTCLLLYKVEDFLRLENLNKTRPASEQEKAKILLEEMKSYIVSGICRRKQILYYFGEKFTDYCGYCDNCRNPAMSYVATPELSLLLASITQTQEQLDVEQICQFMQGVYIPRLNNQQAINSLNNFGKGRYQPESFWKSIIRQALIQGLLTNEVINSSYSLKITYEGQEFLKKEYSINFVKDRVYQSIIINKKNMIPTKNYDEGLFQLLHKLREKIAKEKNIPDYTVLQDSSLEEIASVLPTTLEELAQIGGLSMSKAVKFGTPFIQAIKKYVADNDISTSSDIVVKSKASRSKDKVYIIQQIDRKTSLEEIASAKSMAMDELLDEIEAICYSGVKINLSYYIDTILTKDQQQEIYNYFIQAKQDNIKQAYKVLGKDYAEEDIRLMHISFLSEVAN